MSGPSAALMQRQQHIIYSKLESEIRKEHYLTRRRVDDRVTCIQLTSVNSRYQCSQIILLLLGSYGDAVTFESEDAQWEITTRIFRSRVLRQKILEHNPRIRRRWTTCPFVIPHIALRDIITTDACAPFTGLGYAQLTPDSEGGNIMYSLRDSDYLVTLRLINSCGTVSMEIERDPGQVLDPIVLERISQDSFMESSMHEEMFEENCCCCIL